MYFDESQIEHLRKVFNKEHPENVIPEGKASDVWKELKKRFHNICDTSACVVTKMMHKKSAPESWILDPDEWLSSIDIDKIEQEYQRMFPKYYYVGAVPIDFDKKSNIGKCLVSSLCSLDINSLSSKGYTQIGIIFNTDVSTGPGQHWVALFCDINPENERGRITYFDSYARKPEPEIQVLMKRWSEQWGKPMDATYNKTRHQIQDTECGMYCLYFHLSSLLGLPMDNRIADETVRGLRGALFRVSKQ